ncbi:MAG TPA: hypothetical protein VHM88_10385 [Candidatus Acidoferrales bacterium]|jgi:hypothetical protein|nr:hypothetical protein [Candidatus Acidoferrales bacterium]
MKTIRVSIICSAVLLFVTPILHAQDFSKYRKFSLGSSLATVLKNTDQRLADVKVTHVGSPLLQELTWQPANLNAYRSDSVEHILFSFYKGRLYKMSVIYDRNSTEGLTADDLVKSISEKYGPATSVALAIDSTLNEQYESKQNPIASWEDSQYSFNLVRSWLSGGFELVIYIKQVNAEVEAALAEAVKLEKEEGPRREAERQKKEIDALEVTRQKNQKSFRP